MRFLVVFVLAMMIAIASAQVSTSNTNTNSISGSGTVSNTNTNTNTNSVSGSRTVTWTGTVTGTNSGTVSGSITGTWTGSPSQTQTGTPSMTYPQPPAPINLVNGCLNHIIYVCLEWSNPSGFMFNYYRIYYQSTAAGSSVNVLTSTQPNLNIGMLTALTTYNFWVQGVDTGVGVWSANSSVLTYTTAQADPKYDPTRDIQNFQCAKSRNPTTNRVAITCTWSPAQDTVIHVNLKCHCVAAKNAPFREPLLVRKKLWGSLAQSTSVLFAINRDNADCTIYARFYYQRRPTTRHMAKVNV